MTTSSATERPLTGRVALVTGASRGIGRAAAVALSASGAHVVLLARTRGGLEETDDVIKAAGGTATLVPMDLTESATLDALGPSLFQRFNRLDILVANAASLGTLTPVPHITEADWQQVLDVNLSANWRLIRTLDPLLRRSDAGRGIFVSSGAVQSCRAYWGTYAVSKAGLEALVKVYANELVSTPARVNLLDPGPTRTAMRMKAMPGEDPAALPDPASLGPIFVHMALPQFQGNGTLVNARAHELYHRT